MFTLGQRQLRWYALLFVGGLLGGYAIAVATFLRERVDIAYANVLLVFVSIGAVVGARLGEVFFYEWPYFRAHPAEIFQIWLGGLASHGAVIGIALMLWLYARAVVGKPFLWVLDRAVPGIALAAACVRFGNLMNSEILGKPTAVAWGFVFQRVDAVPRHPVQLYEGIAYVVLCLVLLVASFKYPLPQGCLSGLFLVGMFVPRWFLEFTKDSAHIAAGMNTGQILSVPLVVIGVWMLVVCRSRTVV
jgi:prolipoprotein diacylglyceryl transferase